MSLSSLSRTDLSQIWTNSLREPFKIKMGIYDNKKYNFHQNIILLLLPSIRSIKGCRIASAAFIMWNFDIPWPWVDPLTSYKCFPILITDPSTFWLKLKNKTIFWLLIPCNSFEVQKMREKIKPCDTIVKKLWWYQKNINYTSYNKCRSILCWA